MIRRSLSWLTTLLIGIMSTVVLADDLVQVQLKNFPKTYQFDARIEAVNEATVASRIAAQVIEVNFDVDDAVPKDAVLIRFRDTEFKARLAQAQSNLLAVRAQYQEAKARQHEAIAEDKRVTDLFNRKQVTRSALDKAHADKAAADARLTSLAAQIKLRQAQVDEAEVALSYTVIRAPYAGIVTQRHIEVGEMASPGQLLMSGVSLNSMRAIVKVPQRLIKAVSASSKVMVWNDNQWYDAGQITVLPEADALSHSFTIRVALDADLGFYQGSMSKVQFISGEESLLVVPRTTIVQRSEVAGIYVETQKGIVFRQIRLGNIRGEWVEVLAGLSSGEQVIANPQTYLNAN